MKICPNCRIETRPDAEWCWHCGFSYEEADARTRSRGGEEPDPEELSDTDIGSSGC